MGWKPNGEAGVCETLFRGIVTLPSLQYRKYLYSLNSGIQRNDGDTYHNGVAGREKATLLIYVPIVQWIEYSPPKRMINVQVILGIPNL